MWDSLPNTPSFQAFMRTPEFLELPAMLPPDGVIPDFENPDNLRQPGLAVLQLLIVTLAVSIRFYTKTFILRRTMIEDYWLYMSWVLFVGFHVIVFKAENLPLGVHQYDLKVGKALVHAKLLFIGVGVYAFLMLTLKTAIVLQIRRMFIPHLHTTGLSTYQRYLLYCVHATLAANILYYLPIFIYHWCICRPVQRAWDPRVPGRCVSNDQFYYVISGILNTTSDLVIILVPQPLIWSLKIDRRKKWGLSIVFSLGGLALGTSIARLYYAVQMNRSDDKTYYAALMGKWAEPELTFGFLAICLPVFPSFMKKVKSATIGRHTMSFWMASPAIDTDRTRRVQGPDSGTIIDAKMDMKSNAMTSTESRGDSVWMSESSNGAK
ncbi:hypothetical protein BKA63DRAFT_527045 [Paraphoma chrysanthemicola]|nr:hypothetical protein BKA63DRAFT_527045 [Paraphoma chrysanthemicola]